MKKNIKIVILGIVVNTILFAIKLFGGIFSGSLALLSDSFNSLMDILASFAIFFAVRTSTKKADKDHPFGHNRAEPIAGLIVAIFAAILGFEVIKNAFQGFFEPRDLKINMLIFVIVIFSIVSKVFMYIVFRREGNKSNSPALLASSVDYRNDILVSISVLMGNFFGYIGYPIFDNIVAFCIGLFIVYSGFKIGLQNVDFLMGKVPGKDIMSRLKEMALSIDGVKNLNDVRAHFLGTFIQVEVHIEVDKKLKTTKSHEIAEAVQNLLQEEEIVDYAFVHVDPV
ncbi:MAG TPA: cation transporter [Spirochaetes bacterium]|nr:cation transporter [Spirochaetota bacterium]